MKKLLSAVLLTLVLSTSFVAQAKMKVGLLTGTTSQNEDDFRAAEQAAKKYPGQIVHLTYPDNFMQEQETVISNITSLAADKDVKVIIIGQAIPGSTPGVKKAKRMRKDITFIFYQPHEDPSVTSKVADLVIDTDNLARGKTLPQLAKKMGAKKLVHYSFPRHMSYKLLADRRDLMVQECKKLGLEFVFATMPDPLGEGGVPSAQQFILEDVGRQIKKHGKDTAFFTTNDAAAEPLIKRVAENGAIFLEPDIPSPTMGYPGALGLEIAKEKSGDFDYINKVITEKVSKMGNTGRMANWPKPSSIVAINALVDRAFEANGDKAKIADKAALQATMSKIAGSSVTLNVYQNTPHYQLMLIDSIIY